MIRYALYGGWKGDVVGPRTLIATYKTSKMACEVMEDSFNDMGAMDWFHIEAVYPQKVAP